MEISLDFKKIYLDEAETVSLEFEPLGTEDYQKLIAFVGSGFGSDPKQNLLKMSEPALIELGNIILPKYFRNLTGLYFTKDNVKTDAKVDDLLKYGAFIPFIVKALTEIVVNSVLQSTDVEAAKK